MADSALSALPNVVTIDDTDSLYINDGGVSKYMTLNQLTAYIESRGRVHNASVANQGAGFATDTYLIGSDVLVPTGRLQAKSKYRCKFNVTKTAAGVATPIITMRFGTAGSTADAAVGVLTFAAQTAVADEGTYEIEAVFRTVGSGTSAVLQSVGQLYHRLSITGLSTDVSAPKIATSSGFNSTVAASKIGMSVNAGASAAWTVNIVSAMLENLA